MSDTEWMWWAGSNDECFSIGPVSDREGAIAEGRDAWSGDGFYIVEAKKPENLKLSAYFDADTFVENADENAWEDHGNPDGGDPIFDITNSQRADLLVSVRAAIDTWQDRHSLKFQGWCFSAQRNDEFIPETPEE